MSDQQHEQSPTDASATQASPEAAQMAMAMAGMLEQMSAKFELMSQQIIGKIDEMGARIDELETQMAEKVAAANQAREAKNGPTESS